MLVFEARGKLDYPGVNLSKQSRRNTKHRDRNGTRLLYLGCFNLGILRDILNACGLFPGMSPIYSHDPLMNELFL